MKIILAMVLLLSLLAEGTGTFLTQKLHFKNEGYGAPWGMAAIFAASAIAFYPVQILHGSFYILAGIEICILIVAAVLTILSFREVWAHLKRRKTLWIAAGLLAFSIIFYFCYVDLEYADSVMYLNYISQNIGNPHINLFNLYTGKIGAEWDGLYLYQAYYHFCSVLIWLMNIPFRHGFGSQVETLKGAVWTMGMLYSIISTCLIVDISDRLSFTKKWFRIIVILFAMFDLNFYYWRIVSAYYGNTWRSLFITLLILTAFLWIRKDMDDKAARILMPVISFAGIACSSSYLFISFAALSLLAMYLFLDKRKNVIETMSVFVIPLVVYACIMITRSSKAGLVISAVMILYYALLHTTVLTKILSKLDSLIEKHAKLLFYAVIPAALAVYSFILNLNPDFLYNYSYYFRNHQTVDMVKDYFFVYSTWCDNLVNILRWAGVIALFFSARRPEEQYLRTTAAGMLLVFMNPLCTPAIAATIASNVFYRSWEVLFNPFTEMFLITLLFNSLQNKKVQAAVPAFMMTALVCSNVRALSGVREEQYGYYIAKGSEENHLTKMEPDAEAAVRELGTLIENITDRQPVVISQAEGTRVYLPQVYQLITPRDTYYTDTRINEDLYQIARRHHPWDTDPAEADYSLTAALLKQYHVDYVVVRYWENPEFDEALSKCAENVWQNSYFRIWKTE